MGYHVVALKRVVMVTAAYPPLWRRMAIARGHDSEKWDTALGIKLGFGLQAPVALLDSDTFDGSSTSRWPSRRATDEPASRSQG